MKPDVDLVLVPEPPLESVVIPNVDLEKIKKWIAFFKGVSSRIVITRPIDDNFEKFYKIAQINLRKLKIIDKDFEILGWPDPEDIAFVVSINIAPTGHIVSKFDIQNSFFFCLGKEAFGVTHFRWDGDPEDDHWAKTYSLEG